MTNMKSHSHLKSLKVENVNKKFTPISITLDDLELYKFKFSENFSRFRRFLTQQQLNKWR